MCADELVTSDDIAALATELADKPEFQFGSLTPGPDGIRAAFFT